jgi:signal transduction histidine kinase
VTPDEECAAVLRCLPCGVYVLDGQWRFTFINPMAAQLLEQLSQKPCEQLIGKTIWEECREAADSVAAGEFRRAITEKRTVEFEAFYPALGRWFAFHACPGQERLYVSFHDVSARKRLAGELSRRAEALADAERGKHELLAELAHELRNDLAPIRNALHLMVVPVEGGESVAQARELAEQQVRHAARLLDDLLKTSEIARGKIQPRKVAVDLGTVVATALECELDAIKSRGNSLTIDLPAERLALEADPDLLREMVRRLLDHAAGQTRPGCHIWVTAEAQGEDVVLVVRDDGAGLDRELLPRLFDLFLGPGQSPIHPQGVLRTGLALVRGLAELHGGSVEAFSDGPGLGSQLIVCRRRRRCSGRATRRPDPAGGDCACSWSMTTWRRPGV